MVQLIAFLVCHLQTLLIRKQQGNFIYGGQSQDEVILRTKAGLPLIDLKKIKNMYLNSLIFSVLCLSV